MTDITWPVVAALTTEEVAALLACSVDTLRRMRRRGRGPRWVTLSGGSVRYMRADVEDWINEGGDKRWKIDG